MHYKIDIVYIIPNNSPLTNNSHNNNSLFLYNKLYTQFSNGVKPLMAYLHLTIIFLLIILHC